ncbi:unnamed protein product [Alopecurus aequalis]
MPPFRLWVDLPPELLCRIGEGLDDLRWYGSARGACTAWRRALAPPSPSLLIVPDDDARRSPYAASLPTRRCFEAHPLWGTMRRLQRRMARPFLHRRPEQGGWASKSKLVFAPNPAGDDFTAAVICDVDRLAYVTAGARRWAILDPVRLARGDQLADVVYHETEGKGKVYCLTRYGDVHVLRLPERRRREPIKVDDGSSTPPSLSSSPAEEQHMPDLNAPATVQPLVSRPFDPATGFAPPYNTVATLSTAKNLVVCEGKLYQVWRNTSCVVTVPLPGGGRRRVAENEVLVLRYYPRRKPCWDAVTDLGGYPVFLGWNNAVSMYARGGGVPGIKGDCVYWIGGRGRDLQGMVFDMATGRTTVCRLPPAVAGVAPHSAFCWYLLSDSCNSYGGKRVYQTRARVRADREPKRVYQTRARVQADREKQQDMEE